MTLLRACFNDLAQRLATANKAEQRRYIAVRTPRLGLPPGARVLDFGCGTGLFARPFRNLGLTYVGYDVEPGLVAYARRLRPQVRWTSDLEEVRRAGPYDLILANCCFHHIPDGELSSTVLPQLASGLAPDGVLLLIDVLPPEPGASALRQAHARLEQGGTRRSLEHLDAVVSTAFNIRSREVERWYLLSLATPLNPIYTYVAAYELRPRR
jgi:SAM-dependent methyltransferase